MNTISMRDRRDLKILDGVMPVRGLMGEVVRDLGCRIVSGEWADGMPRESDLIDSLGVSRSVVREALRVLSAKGLIRSRQMEGTKVLPRSEWRLLDPDLIDWRIRAGDTRTLLEDLLKVRLVLEPGVVFVATTTATEDARARIAAAWQTKLAVEEDDSLPGPARRQAFIDADLVFHREFLAAVGSEILDQLFGVVQAALALLIDLQMRAKGSEVQLIGMDESTELHRQVFEAYMRGDAIGAEQAMRRLIERAIADAEEGFALLD
ncbi:FadR/GntR family transcriptional regulator [Bauldia sp.]|uniref:FadR/GntR family transcriptional regulator n=1 Tax=Bauldia sp. TaxID=2575872 RepID=UPI003BA9E8AC